MPQFLAGQKLRASALNNLAKMAFMSSSVTVNNSTTFVNATGLSLSLDASTSYAIDGWLHWQSNPTPDIKFQWTVPSGMTGFWMLLGPPGNVAPVAGSERINYGNFGVASQATSFSAAGDDEFTGTVFIAAFPHATFTTTNAGTLQLQFAQNTANGSDTILRIGSWIRAVKLDT